MASDAPKRRSKPGSLPGKLRNFVNDMKRFKLHRHGRKASEQASMQATMEPTMEPTSAPEVAHIPETKSASSPRSSLPVANLAVHVTITFDEPLNYSYIRNYEASPSLQATEILCQGLLRRVDHCCHELITRKDSTAMEYAAASGSDKPLRYEIQIDIIRDWSEIWASRTFRSYQKQLLSAEAAREVILSTHHIVGLFLRTHDEGFVWKDGPVREDPSEKQGKFPHRAGRVQPLSCVPRAYFLEKSQSFELAPGYTINFSFTSRCQRRKQPEWHQTVEVNSSQATPLNSIGAESLFLEASYALEHVLRSERQAFEKLHGPCASLDGCKDCRHHDSDGLELHFSIANNLGPEFPHLERTIHCSSNLAFYSGAQKCLAFVNQVEAALTKVRDDADDALNGMNDLEFRIIELRGHGWSLDEPLVFVLGSSCSNSRRSTEAVLDRIQAGVADILRGNAISVRMTAHKRGHFILDKTFVSREPPESSEKRKANSPRKSKAYVLGRLRQRIKRDIEIFCKDTLTLDTEEEVPNTEKVTPPLEPNMPIQDADVMSSTSGPETTEPIPVGAEEPKEEFASATPVQDTIPSTSMSKDRIENEAPPSPAASSGSTGRSTHSIFDGRPSIPVRRSSVPIFCSKTGARAFPLVPGLDHYVESGSVEDANGANSHQDTSGQPADEHQPQDSEASAPHDAIPNETQESEAEPTPTMNTEEPEPASVSAYESSVASSTPSLMYSSKSSPASSLLVTPRTQRHSTDVNYPKDAVADSDDEGSRDSESVSGAEAQHELAVIQPFPPQTLRHAAKPITSSPLRVSQNAQGQNSANSSESVETLLKDSSEPVSPSTDQEALAAPTEMVHLPIVSQVNIDHPDTPTSTPPVNDMNRGNDGADAQDPKQDTACLVPSVRIETPNHVKQAMVSEFTPQITGAVKNVDVDAGIGTNTDDFSRSKPDFIFSSPPATTPNDSDSEEENDSPTPSPNPRPRDMSPDPAEEDLDLDMAFESDISAPPTPKRPLHPQRRSFGSAGILGFHEQIFGSLNMRTALMRSPPGSPSRPGSSDQKRPGTAM
ncbi:hypothetical protein GGS26DRAFT_586452 [Hypomontagnella submonticulosa]|nr:hypothetical protein GGS26DRAFT_586452 [Hypomontagnella submonticulosa]